MTASNTPVIEAQEPLEPPFSPYLLWSSLVAALGGLLFGFDTAVISGTTDALTLVYGLSSNALGFTVASAAGHHCWRPCSRQTGGLVRPPRQPVRGRGTVFCLRRGHGPGL